MDERIESRSISTFLNQDENKDLLRLLTAGSVDDGKSTLIGRLLYDSKKLYEDQLATLENDNRREGHAGDEIDYALLLDGLKAEREQGITIDVAYRYFSTNRRKFIIADTPGHEQYTRNMITGGSTADLAIILVDATRGVLTQTRRHTFLVDLLGIKHVILAVNKMDLVDYDHAVFEAICEDYKQFITRLSIPDLHFIPLSALKGDNVVEPSVNMEWYSGQCILDLLENIHITSDRNFIDLRYPVQYVQRPDNSFRGFSGPVVSGIIRKGAEIMILPSMKRSRVASIVTYDGNQEYAFPPQSVTVTLADEIDISRGDMLVHPQNVPRIECHVEATLVWMDEKRMNPDTQFYLKQTTSDTRARIDALRYRIDVNTLHKSVADILELNDIGRVLITTTKPLFFDPYAKNRGTGSFILIDPVTHNTAAVGMIIDRMDGSDLPSRIPPNRITAGKREHLNPGRSLVTRGQGASSSSQKGMTLWFTGLSGSGKSTIAEELAARLAESGIELEHLDGDDVRGIFPKTGFSREERDAHIQHIGFVASLLEKHGVTVICTFVSPYRDTRNLVREMCSNFVEIHISTPYEECERRDVKGLYAKARKGEISHFTGLDDPYEVPLHPEISIDTTDISVGDAVQKIIDYLSYL